MTDGALEADGPIEQASRWWERRTACVALVLVGLVPLLWPALPPLTDLPGHMGRWHISMDIGKSAPLAHYYAFAWEPVGNLGMDLLVPALAAVLPFELAAKIGVMIIPAVTMAGMLWVAREVHGRVTPTALLALPLAYASPFQMGFVNFALAQGLALCALGLWLRLARQRRFGLRAAIFVPTAGLLWLAHSFGWAVFCIMASGVELARLRGECRRWGGTLAATAVQVLPLAWPLLVMLLRAGGPAPIADDWFNWSAKVIWVTSILRDRWQILDLLSLVPIALALYAAARSSKLGFSAILGWPALLCLAAFVVMPRLALGGAYVDMRLAPLAAMLGLLAVKPPAGSVRFAQILAGLALAFFLVRITATTASFVLRSAEQQRELAAIPAIPYGASVISLVARPCGGVWSDLRRDHLPAMAIVRRDAFTNEQWALKGQQLLRIRNLAAQPYLADPSQLVYPAVCAEMGSRFGTAIRTFPRRGFTHVWTIGFPPGAAASPDLQLIWTNGNSAVYRVRR